MNASEQIDKQIADLGDWRGDLISRLRGLVRESDPGLKEEWKWGTAVWTSNGNVCAAGAFKDHVKLNFFNGASLEDPDKLFNGGLDAKASRSVDFRQADPLNEPALTELVRSAVAFNNAAKGRTSKF